MTLMPIPGCVPERGAVAERSHFHQKTRGSVGSMPSRGEEFTEAAGPRAKRVIRFARCLKKSWMCQSE